MRVSTISLGTVELGLDHGIKAGAERMVPDEGDAAALLDYALDRGINLIDKARAYGSSERIIGRALRSRRTEYILVSKIKPGPSHCGAWPGGGEPARAADGLDRRDDAALRQRAGTRRGVRRRAGGQLRFIGASVYGAGAALAAIESGRFDCIEVAYSVLDRRPELAVLAAARRHDIGVIARSVLLKGALTHRCRLLPEGMEGLERSVGELASIVGSYTSLPEFSYRYVLAHDPPHTALGGASRAELAGEPAAPLDLIRTGNAGRLAAAWAARRRQAGRRTASFGRRRRRNR